MSNRKLRSFSRGLSIHELRRMALGEELVRFCDEEEPKIRSLYCSLREQVEGLAAENLQDMLRAQLMLPEDGEASKTFGERRNDALARTHERAANLIAMAKDLQGLIDRMSAGGGAAVWAGMQRGMARQQQRDESGEREAKPVVRRFNPDRLAEASDVATSQPLEADIIPE